MLERSSARHFLREMSLLDRSPKWPVTSNEVLSRSNFRLVFLSRWRSAAGQGWSHADACVEAMIAQSASACAIRRHRCNIAVSEYQVVLSEAMRRCESPDDPDQVLGDRLLGLSTPRTISSKARPSQHPSTGSGTEMAIGEGADCPNAADKARKSSKSTKPSWFVSPFSKLPGRLKLADSNRKSSKSTVPSRLKSGRSGVTRSR